MAPSKGLSGPGKEKWKQKNININTKAGIRTYRYRCKRDYKGIRYRLDQSEYAFHLTRSIKCNKKNIL